MFAQSMELVSLLALATLLVLAVWHDLLRRRIPNTLVLWGALTALALSLTPRGIGLDSALLGGMAGFLVFFSMYLFKMVGAGDVKLVAAVGMLVGWPEMAQVCVAILITGGLVAVAWAICTSRLQSVMRNIHTGLMQNIRTGQWPQIGQPLISQVSHERVPYALAIGLGTAAHFVVTR
ncbi:prepilin peptidase [Limnohabitans sp.]|jgi:prepilin peptidase CpaA|uniref:prepilin peptidase n=1 Tax=Limnohabitans sp. TaxID=1907725 RepID=UPI0037BE4305